MHTWTDERGADRKLTVITDAAFCVDDSDGTEFAEAVVALSDGADVTEVLDGDADRIELSRIFRVDYNTEDTDLTIHFRETNKDGKEENESETWFYSSGMVRDEIAAALQQALGKEFTAHTDTYSVTRAVYAPLLTLVLTLLFSWILFGAAQGIADGADVDTSGKRSFLKKIVAWLLDMLGPTGVMIIAWLIAATTLYWLYRRGMSPPVMRIIQSAPYKAPTVVGTLVKYGILLGLAFITVRAITS